MPSERLTQAIAETDLGGACQRRKARLRQAERPDHADRPLHQNQSGIRVGKVGEPGNSVPVALVRPGSPGCIIPSAIPS
jgi:hypothetical protein